MDDQGTDRKGGGEPIMSTPNKCLHCGSENLEPGSIGGFGILFRPDRMPFLTLSKGAGLGAVVCQECGAIQLWADPEKIKSLMPREE
jgi:hypothetical protein